MATTALCLALFATGLVIPARVQPGRGAVKLSGSASEAPPLSPIPLTILSGFLGAGKTTLLSHVLNNKEGTKVGVIVNDVAAINIDAKLLARGGTAASGGDSKAGESALEGWGEDMLQLSNGCACCSAGDDLLSSLAELISLSFVRGAPYDHIVVESSGVAEPRLLRAMFQEAAAMDWPLMRCLRLENMVTVVDASGFLREYESSERIADRPDLLGPEAEDSSIALAPGGAEEMGVVQLLVEQVETADVILLNKADLCSEGDLAKLEQILDSLNGFASQHRAQFGVVPLSSILVSSREAGVSTSNEVMDHKSSVDWANWLTTQQAAAQTGRASAEGEACVEPGCADPTHDHAHAASHDHSHSSKDEACAEPGCTDPDHSHAANHDHSSEEACAEPACTDPTHDHSHASTVACAEPACTDPTHDHSHASEDEACADQGCTDPTHDHSHGARAETTAATRFGIRTFVYSRRQPFDADKLAVLVEALPFIASVAAPLRIAQPKGSAGAEAGPFEGLLRSKGFMWVSGEDDVAYFWSQAGKRLDVNEMGRWWASVDREQWPKTHVDNILEDFEGESGDRRQELVFIGAGLDEAAITKLLDGCLAA